MLSLFKMLQAICWARSPVKFGRIFFVFAWFLCRFANFFPRPFEEEKSLSFRIFILFLLLVFTFQLFRCVASSRSGLCTNLAYLFAYFLAMKIFLELLSYLFLISIKRNIGYTGKIIENSKMLGNFCAANKLCYKNVILCIVLFG